MVHRLSGGRWSGEAWGGAVEGGLGGASCREETWFCGISSVRPGEPQLDAPGLGLLWAGDWLCDDPGGPEGAEQEMVWVSLRPEGGYVLVRWGCSLQGLGKGQCWERARWFCPADSKREAALLAWPNPGGSALPSTGWNLLPAGLRAEKVRAPPPSIALVPEEQPSPVPVASCGSGGGGRTRPGAQSPEGGAARWSGRQPAFDMCWPRRLCPEQAGREQRAQTWPVG